MKNPKLKTFVSGILAGLAIALGGMVYLSVDNKVVGAVLFTLGLCCVCTYGMYLYTGRIGYISRTKKYLDLLLGWLGNLVGAVGAGKLFVLAKPTILDKAKSVCAGKLSQSFGQTVILAAFCGALVYFAVDLYKRLKDKDFIRYTGILLCIPAFILCGFEHSIADMFYMAAGGAVVTGFPFLLAVTLGNSIGAIVVDALVMAIKEE